MQSKNSTRELHYHVAGFAVKNPSLFGNRLSGLCVRSLAAVAFTAFRLLRGASGKGSSARESETSRSPAASQEVRRALGLLQAQSSSVH